MVFLSEDETQQLAASTVEREGDVLKACVEAMPFAAAEPFRMRMEFSGTAGERDHYGLFTTQSETSELPSFYTQFESQGARLALPLVDEPYDKATTTVYLTGHLDYTLLSNGEPVGCESHNPGWQTCTWHNADPISSYMITFVAAELERVVGTYERPDGSTVPLTVYTEPEHTTHGLYSMYALQRSFAIFEQAYGLPYPWDRYGIVALPGFRYGGMENKGLTNIAAAGVYFEPGETPLRRRYGIYGVTAHELAHEWFGNLVTMQWWDDVWLNEGFATYMTDLAMREEFDGVARSLGDMVGLERWYMAVERGPFAHPIVYDEWTTPEQLFDAISYTKGRKVLQMLEVMVGRDNLFAGIRRYLVENAGSNAATARFFDTIEAETGQDLTAFVDAWLFEAGFPEVTFEPEWNAADGTFALHVRQESSQGAEHDAVWTFPIRIAVEGAGWSEEQWFVIVDAEHTLEFDVPDEPTVVSVNRGGTALIDVAMAGWTAGDWAAQALIDSDPFGRGMAIFEALELAAADYDPTASLELASAPYLAETLRAAIDGDSEALRSFAIGRLTDDDLPVALRASLAGALVDELVGLLEGPEPGEDILAVDTHRASLAALGLVDNEATRSILREYSSGRVDFVGPAVGAYLRTDAQDRFGVHGQAVEEWKHNNVVLRSLIGALASTPHPAIFELLRGYLNDETVCDPLDHRMPRTMVSSLINGNADLAYTAEGMAFLLDVFEHEIDRRTDHRPGGPGGAV